MPRPQAPAGYQQAPAGYPQPYPPQYQPPRPPKRSSPIKSVLLGLVLVVGIGLFAMSLMSFLFGDENGGGTATGRPSTVVTTEVPTIGPTQTESPPPTATPSRPVDTWQAPEPDFSPPDLPVPETYGEAKDWLVDNAAYAESVLNPTLCDLRPIDASRASVDELTVHLNLLTACLMKVWQEPITDAGFKLPRPPVTVYNEPITTGCGELNEVNAVYCGADQRIYYAKPVYRIFPENLQDARFLVEMIIAHEFGHAIQGRTGILISSAAWQQQGTEAEGRVFSRRLETQADCLSGMFQSAVAEGAGLTGNDLATLKELTFNLGDDVLTGQAGYDGDHGLGKNRQRWFTAGFETTSIGTCNTYVVPNSQVR